MIEEVLQNIAYRYFPKNVDALDQKQKYIDSIEYRSLRETINSFQPKSSSYLKLFKSHTASIIDEKRIVDATLVDWEDRCFNFQFGHLEGSKYYSICLNMSFLIPFYSVYCLEVDIDLETGRWKGAQQKSENGEKKFQELFSILKTVSEKKLNLSAFPEDLIKNNIPNISFQDIKMGEVTMFNAFFLNEYSTRT